MIVFDSDDKSSLKIESTDIPLTDKSSAMYTSLAEGCITPLHSKMQLHTFFFGYLIPVLKSILVVALLFGFIYHKFGASLMNTIDDVAIILISVLFLSALSLQMMAGYFAYMNWGLYTLHVTQVTSIDSDNKLHVLDSDFTYKLSHSQRNKIHESDWVVVVQKRSVFHLERHIFFMVIPLVNFDIEDYALCTDSFGYAQTEEDTI